MCRDELVDKLDVVLAKVSVLAWFNPDIGQDVSYGLYLIVDGIADDIKQIKNDLKVSGEGFESSLTELFDSSKSQKSL